MAKTLLISCLMCVAMTPALAHGAVDSAAAHVTISEIDASNFRLYSQLGPRAYDRLMGVCHRRDRCRCIDDDNREVQWVLGDDFIVAESVCQ